MYWRDKWSFQNSNEYEIKFAGKYGAKGEKRNKKEKPTPEQIKKQNQTNKENRIRRLIKANFLPADLWMTLKYPKGTRKSLEEVKGDMEKFLGKMRYRYKKQEQQFKFIYRIEIGKLGGLHIHILMNRIPDVDVMVSKCWIPGYVHFTPIYEAGGYKELASYIAKPPPEEQEDTEEFHETCSYSSSRNLIRPEPERKYYSRRTVRDIVENGPEPSSKEFYIDKSTIEIGTNNFTGMSYIRYTECRIKEIWSGGAG